MSEGKTAMQPHMIPLSSQAPDRVMLIVDALRGRFGADAVLVAERQLKEADGDSRAIWRAIVDHLSI